VGEVTASVWENARFVAIDTETTGLHDDARIVSVACFCVENAVTVQAWSTVINAGTYGAQHIHGLGPATLDRAQPFAVHAEHLRGLLTLNGGAVFLVAHNIAYDAARLAYEYSLLGQPLPDVVLLDTRDLARAAGFVVPGGTLDDLATAFGLTNVARHEANADAIIVREVALKCLNLLDAAGANVADLASTTPPVPTASPATPKITSAHAELHDMVLLTKKDRDASLGGCLALSCHDLHKRIEDGVTSAATSRACFDWTLTALGRNDLSRLQRGLLVAGAARVLTSWRDIAARPDHKMLFTKAVAVLATAKHWTVCDATDECDHCAAGGPERCRFVTGPQRLLWPALYNTNGSVVTNSAKDYLTGTAKTPLTTKSWWHKAHAHAPDAANAALTRITMALRQSGRSELARPAVESLWKKGVRDPRLATVYATMVEDDKDTHGKLTALNNAAAICQTALASPAVAATPEWQQVKQRLHRLQGRINATSKKPPQAPYNTRPPHRSRFVKP
jgi:DNA polymerase III epsilon subunit-like protein/ribosome-binding factor A